MKILFKKVSGKNFTKKEKEKTIWLAEQGSIPAMIGLIMHNQLVLNVKLNKILIKLNMKG